MHQWGIFHSKWICCIENILNDCGYSEYWIAQNVTKNVYLSKNVKLRLCDQLKKNGLQLFSIHQSVLITEFLNVIMV